MTPELEGVASAAEKVEKEKTFRFALTIGQPDPVAGEGAIDLARQRVLLRMELDESRADNASGTFEVVIADQVVYVKNPEFPTVGGKDWIRMEGPPGPSAFPDPTSALDVLDAGGDFEEIGQEDVRGVQTTRYRGTITKGSAPAPDGSRVEAWLDAGGYPRRLTFGDGQHTSIDFYDFGADVNIAAPPRERVVDLAELGREGDGLGVELPQSMKQGGSE
ncbi:MAG: hypothetical protein ACRDLU_08315 [Gaiellaceae bacterium]